MTAKPDFLRSIAGYILQHYSDMSRLTLVFPNKRSAMFMKKYMREMLVRTSSRPAFMPRMVTMGNFISRLASRIEMPRTEQLFLLYDCYSRILAANGRESYVRDFDRFVFWGSMILDDFDDVDRQLVDAAKLFKNLKDLKEINADYLDDEQKRVVRRIWGETPRTESITEFWTHVGNETDGSPEQSFITLWQLLGELYTSFKHELHERGLDTAGGLYREAAATVRQYGITELQQRHIIFIGFYDLSHSELFIMRRLRDAGTADFFWDFDTRLVALAFPDTNSSPLHRLKQNFPMPSDYDSPNCQSLPSIEVISVASMIGQAKAAGAVLSRMGKDNLLADDPIDTAVVLPDENLLIPFLLSLPNAISDVNVTMGIPFSITAFASMLRSVISMQLRSRLIHGSCHYYYADVIQLLSHPHIQLIAPLEAEALKRHISKCRLFNLDAEALCRDYPELAFIFRPVKSFDNPDDIYNYLDLLISSLRESLSSRSDQRTDSLPEIEMLDYFRTGIDELLRLIQSYDIHMNESTWFSLFERLLDARRIDLQGTPLRGLQVMGVLETRALDFNNIVTLSVNENTFPRKNYLKTMIPNSLRVGYGMDTIDRRDSLYAYCFYRMLARAENVTLIYDSRTASFGAGEPSRYIGQLANILPPNHIRYRELSFSADFNAPRSITVKKTDAVLQSLSRFREVGNNARLSASALKEYKKCRLCFYLKYVHDFRGENEISDYISPALYGNIVHKIVETLYHPYEDRLVTADIIGDILADNTRLDKLVYDTVFDQCYSTHGSASSRAMPAEGSVTCSIISLYLRKMLEIEQRQAAITPFRYIKGEMDVKTPPQWTVSPGLSINFTMKIDRVDSLAPDLLRFIDYKTGADKSAPTKLEKIFERERHDDDAVFQLLIYALAYTDLVDSSVAILPQVYPLRVMAAENAVPPIIVDGDVIDNHRQLEPRFRQQLSAMIQEIFSPDIPFDQATDCTTCRNCPFLDLCGRAVPEY